MTVATLPTWLLYAIVATGLVALVGSIWAAYRNAKRKPEDRVHDYE